VEQNILSPPLLRRQRRKSGFEFSQRRFDIADPKGFGDQSSMRVRGR
jgi:hypothetical protein